MLARNCDSALDPGCHRFDSLRDPDDLNKFVFNEAYVDDDIKPD